MIANDLAWFYITGPDPSRHAAEAVTLAEPAINAPGKWEYQNTLGMAYYHAGRFRTAIKALQESLRLSAGAGTPSTSTAWRFATPRWARSTMP